MAVEQNPSPVKHAARSFPVRAQVKATCCLRCSELRQGHRQGHEEVWKGKFKKANACSGVLNSKGTHLKMMAKVARNSKQFALHIPGVELLVASLRIPRVELRRMA